MTRIEELRQIMALSWSFCKECGYDRARALKVAWVNMKLVNAMHKGIVMFKYEKLDGSIRLAHGTLALGRVPATNNTERRRSDKVQSYYDTEKGAWRSYRKENLLNAVIF